MSCLPWDGPSAHVRIILLLAGQWQPVRSAPNGEIWKLTKTVVMTNVLFAMGWTSPMFPSYFILAGRRQPMRGAPIGQIWKLTRTVVMTNVLFAMGWTSPMFPSSFSSRARFSRSMLFHVPTFTYKDQQNNIKNNCDG
jgi:hypothetical protein